MSKLRITITKEIDADRLFEVEPLWDKDGEINTNLTNKEITQHIENYYKMGYVDCLGLVDGATWSVETIEEK